MKKIALILTLVFALAVISGGCDFLKKKPVETPPPTPIPTPIMTPEPTPEATPELGPAPTFGSIKPTNGVKGTIVEVDELVGTGFVAMDTKVFLVAGGNEIEATDVGVISDTKLTCKFNLTGADLGMWDLKIVTPNGEVIETGAFKVYVPSSKTPTMVPTKTHVTNPSIGKSNSGSSPNKTPVHKTNPLPTGK